MPWRSAFDLPKRVRQFGLLNVAGQALTFCARAVAGVELKVGMCATAAEILTAAPTTEDDFVVIRGDDLRATLPALEALNPQIKRIDTGQVDRIAVARERRTGRVIGYWRFLGCGDALYDRDLFVAEDARGRGIAAALLRAAAADLASTAHVYAGAQLFNRPSLRALARAGMRPHLATLACNIPSTRLRWTSEWELLPRRR